MAAGRRKVALYASHCSILQDEGWFSERLFLAMLLLMDVVKKVALLRLPKGEYVVFGSGPLAAHGIRASNDIDLFITSKLYQRLKADGWEEKQWASGGNYLAKDEFEADDSWHYNTYNPTPEYLISKAEYIEGIPFAPLSEVLAWKRAFRRPKDLQDIELIKTYLAKKS